MLVPCASCGHQISPAARLCPKCYTKVTCKLCKEPFKEYESDCLSCGHPRPAYPQGDSTTNEPPAETSDQISDGTAWILSAAILAGDALVSIALVGEHPTVLQFVFVLLGFALVFGFFTAFLRLVLSKFAVDFTTFATCFLLGVVSMSIGALLFYFAGTRMEFEASNPLETIRKLQLLMFASIVLSELVVSVPIWRKPLPQLVLANLGVWVLVAVSLYAAQDLMGEQLMRFRF